MRHPTEPETALRLRGPLQALLLALATLLGCSPPRAATPDPLARVVVMGASVSDGFGVRLRATLPDGTRPTRRVDLADLIQAAARDGDIGVVSLATDTYFMQPDATARRSVEDALKARPTLVIAIDWLFWNAYGVRGVQGKPLRTCEDRLALLATALDRLDQLAASGVPMVVGDLPDMQDSVEGGMLVQAMVPPDECLDQLNERVRAWARGRPNVAIAPMSELVRCTLAQDPVTACGRVWSEAHLGPLMQRDRLHPTLTGTMAVLAVALDQAQRVTGQPVTSRFDMDPAELRQRLLARMSEGSVATPNRR
jgi:hypothetical protein